MSWKSENDSWYDTVYYAVYDLLTLVVRVLTIGMLYYGIRVTRWFLN